MEKERLCTKMASVEIQRNRGSWTALSTVTNFDNGINTLGRVKKPRKMAAVPTANSIFIQALIEQLCRLLENDPKRQKKVFNLICSKLEEMYVIDNSYAHSEFSSLRQNFLQALVFSPLNYSTLPRFDVDISRYKSDYEEMGFIAAGGFGRVFKAKHKLDKVTYAVKKILLHTQSIDKYSNSLQEVKTLAKLNHPNIVQYKSAWLEPVFQKHTQPALPAPELKSSSSDSIVFEEDSDGSNNNKNESDNERSEQSDNGVVCQYNHEYARNWSCNPGLKTMLYVSMQLCDESLRQWLDHRNTSHEEVNFQQCLTILMQTAAGLEYIHSNNIVHHDIKPSNIFLNKDLKHVQVGDFGLSCSVHGFSTDEICVMGDGKVGTALYMAPEQLKKQCHQNSDMYSLGLVLIELFTPFQTDMERVEVIKKCRDSVLPDSLPSSLVPIAKKLLSRTINDRPSASLLLSKLHKLTGPSLSVTKVRVECISEITSTCKCSKTEQLEKEILNKDDEILRLKQMLSEKDKEISYLRSRLHKKNT